MQGERPRNWRKITIMGASISAAVVFFVAGILFWGGFNTVMEATNDLKFCSSTCHEMSWVYEEYQDRPHYENATGVGAECSDCHVPDSWGPKMIRKIKASREVWHWMLGTIDTKEKFEGKRLDLAENVWRSMLATDSRECRNCHDWSNMDLEEQAKRASREHSRAFEQGQTCIECHQGIAHELPEDWDESPVWEEHFAATSAPDEQEESSEPEEPRQEEDLGEATSVSENLAASLDWEGVSATDLTLFLPGQASIEWVQDGGEHGGSRAVDFGDRCIWCHQGEEADIGEMAVTAEKIETFDLGDKRGHVPMSVKAAFDDEYLYMQFQWEEGEHAPLPFAENDGKMDPDNPFKLTLSLSDDQVELADQAGCWASCHHDSRHMPDAPEADALATSDLVDRLDLSDGVTKYLGESRTEVEVDGGDDTPRGGWDKLKEEAEIQELLDGGAYLNLARYKSGDGSTESGYVLDERHFSDSEAVVFSAQEEDGVWTAYLTRALKTGVEGDKPLDLDKLYSANIALHDDFADSRFHHVSWQYGLAFGVEDPDETFGADMVEINATRVE